VNDINRRLNRINCFVVLVKNQEIGDMTVPVREALDFIGDDLRGISREYMYEEVALHQLSGMVDDLSAKLATEKDHGDYFRDLAARRCDELHDAKDEVTGLRIDLEKATYDIKVLEEKIRKLTNAPVKLNRYGITYEEHELIRSRNSIMAIKSHRARTGLGLKESKDFIEDVIYNKYKLPRSDGMTQEAMKLVYNTATPYFDDTCEA
jgi:hypothetical protein